MTILLYSMCTKLKDKVPAVIIGLILDGITVYAGYHYLSYVMNYYSL